MGQTCVSLGSGANGKTDRWSGAAAAFCSTDLGTEIEDTGEYKPHTEVYEGQWQVQEKRHVKHGEGTLSGAAGDRYFGQWQRDKAHGHGVLNLPGGAVYDGEFDGDRATGHGVFTHTDGTTYEGQWMHDAPNGEGKETFVDSSTYNGHFEGGMKQGYGVYKLADGSVYEGQFRENQIHGYGLIKFADGRIYQGQWRHNQLSGEGEMRWPDESNYVGGYYDNLKHGSGRYEWADGKYFEGEWRSGVQHGVGCFGVPWLKSAGSALKERVGVWTDGRRAAWIDVKNDPTATLSEVCRMVTLTKQAAGEKFGFMYSTPRGGQTFLLISRIVEGGLLYRWNAEKIEQGAVDDIIDLNARIVGVNGVRGEIAAMKDQLHQQSVQLEILNPIHRRLKINPGGSQPPG